MRLDNHLLVLIALAICVVVVGVANFIPIQEFDITVHPINGLSTGNYFIVASQDGTTISVPNFGMYSLIIDSDSCNVVATRNIYGVDTVKEIVECRGYKRAMQK